MTELRGLSDSLGFAEWGTTKNPDLESDTVFKLSEFKNDHV